MKKETPSWLKSKGYLHITPQIDTTSNPDKILKKIQNKEFIARYAFYPLIHSIIKERKYKKINNSKSRAHSYKDEKGVCVKTIKNRPLHYATHMDAIIFGYYADLLQSKYEDKLIALPKLSESIIAYRKIPIDNEATNKGTIHFANEVFEEIRQRTVENSECFVLAFDIKSFFSSLDHIILKREWCDLLNIDRLPNDHYNVFKAATQFSYILKDDLRIYNTSKGRRPGFNEKELSKIRSQSGINSFFESPKDFRDQIKAKKINIYKWPFRNEDKQPIGIPQGLPISAILANLYLFNFDLEILKYLINDQNCFYRRYSDDIVIICNKDQQKEVENFVLNSIEKLKIKISTDKTEIFHFTVLNNIDKQVLECKKISQKGDITTSPFIYLGFEFNGRNALIKSANLSKFYRRMIYAVKRKAKRARKISELTPGSPPIIYRRQLYKLYSNLDLSKTKIQIRWKRLVKTELGHYKIISQRKKRVLKGNYFSYAKRASEIMKEPKILGQVRNHKKIFNQAINKHLKTFN